MGDEDWLNINQPEGVQEQNAKRASELASLYFDAFVRNAAGARLLEMWIDADFNQPVPVNAPHTQYAAVEARRDFIRGIRRQIELAKQGISVG